MAHFSSGKVKMALLEDVFLRKFFVESAVIGEIEVLFTISKIFCVNLQVLMKKRHPNQKLLPKKCHLLRAMRMMLPEWRRSIKVFHIHVEIKPCRLYIMVLLLCWTIVLHFSKVVI